MSSVLRVLIVEDSADDAELVMRELHRSGYELVSERVETPGEMTAALERAEWDVILSDYTMPHFNALRALELLKAKGLDIPFIIISGTIGEETAVNAMKAGAQDYIIKGRLARLVPALEREIREAQVRRERRLAEAENARLALVVNSSDDAILSVTAEETIATWNAGAERMYGYAPEEILGQHVSVLLPEERRRDLAGNRERLKRGEALVQYEVEHQRKDKSRLVVSLTLSPIRDAAGAVTGVSAIARDMTEHRRLERQFQQAQKMEAVGRLAGGLAHDFNNYLTIINGFSQMLLSSLGAADPAREWIGEIKKAGAHASSLMRDLLVFSRQQVLSPRVLDLNAVVADLEKMLRHLIGADVELAVVPGAALGQVKADAGQIKQVILNLAVNARDAMPRGGKLTIETTNFELHAADPHQFPALAAGQYVLLAVSDTGMGMDTETQAHIFEPFFTTKEEGKGTGLGLAMVYGTVKQSGGGIWVHSEPGQGATFKIYLPRVDETGESVQPSEAQGDVAGTETILLVEDDPTVRDFAARMLRSFGYKILESKSPEDALAMGDQRHQAIDLLLTDVVLPRMSGRSVAEHLSLVRPGLRVLYMSGYTDGAIHQGGVLEANTAYVQKPFTPDALARKVREVLGAGRKQGA